MTARRAAAAAAGLVAVGIAGAILVALVTDAPVRDTAAVVALAAGGAAAALVVAAGALRLLRTQALGLQIAVVAIAVGVAVATGVGLATVAMFLSSHDATVVAMVLSTTAGIAGAAGVVAGRWYGSQVRAVEVAAEHLASAPSTALAPPPPQAAEIAQLRRRLTDAAEALAAARARQEALEHSRREFVAWVSHDLRSPIAAIRAISESLEDGLVDTPEEQARYHRAIRDETVRLGRLVDDLFELARLESGTPPTDTTAAPADEVVAEVVDLLRPAAAARAVDLVDVSDLGGSHVPAAELRRVLRNLLDNAVRHTPPGGTVVVDGEATPGRVTVRVTDECGGIPADDLERVFEVAYRGDAARRRDGGGGGLGLAIARGVVERCEGRIWVENRPHGCRFSVELPTVTP